MRPAIAVAVILALRIPAQAQQQQPDPATVAEARKRFAEGEKLFEAADFKGAVEAFKEAYRLTHNALLLYNIGFTYDKLGDETLALHYYGKFIDEAQDNDRTHAQLALAGKRAVELRSKLGTEEPATQPATQPAEPMELGHEPIDQAPPGQPIDVTARVPRTAAWTVTLAYRDQGQDLYQTVKMKPRADQPTEVVARIPAAAAQGTAVQYYIAARDPDNKLVGFSGKAQTPNLIYIDPAAPPHHGFEPGVPEGPAPPAAPVVIIKKIEPPTRPLTVGKWAASGGAVAILGAAVVLNLEARSYSDTLQDEARKSTTEQCSGDAPPPCRPFSAQRKDLQKTGEAFEMWSNVALISGAAVAIGAGFLWYLDAREVHAAPVVGPGTVGATAEVHF
jgi:hypothetical protein